MTKFSNPLQPRKNPEKRIIGFDAETYGHKNKFILACFSTLEKRITCKSKKEVREFILHRDWHKSKLVATNLGFDFFACFDKEDIDKMHIIEEEGRLYGVVAYIKDGDFTRDITDNKLEMLDTGNFMPVSVAKLGKMIGSEKLIAPSWLGKYPKNEKDWNDLETYCIQDANISRKFMVIVQDVIIAEGGILKMTAASTSLNVFRTKYQKEGMLCVSDMVSELEYGSYYGGRTEVFQRGKVENANYYDFNSMYPKCMLEKLPDPNSRRQGIADMHKIINYEGVCEVEVKAPKELKIPFLPHRIETDDGLKLVFPLGNWKAIYTFLDIRNAIKYGYKFKPIGRCIYYTKTKPMFKEYIEEMYAKRLLEKDKNSPFQLVYKLLMNSLYGKFGQKPRSKKEWIPKEHITMKQINECKVQEMNNFYIVDDENFKRPMFVQPILSSYITSHARAMLYESLKDCDPIYCDTDSIVTKKKMPNDPKTLGALALEKEILTGVFIKAKLYAGVMREGGKVFFELKSKGINQRSKNPLDLFRMILTNKDITQQRFIKLRRAERSKEHHKTGKLSVNQIIVENKTLNLEDTKRIWDKPFDPSELQRGRPIVMGVDIKA